MVTMTVITERSKLTMTNVFADHKVKPIVTKYANEEEFDKQLKIIEKNIRTMPNVKLVKKR